MIKYGMARLHRAETKSLLTIFDANGGLTNDLWHAMIEYEYPNWRILYLMEVNGDYADNT